MNKQSNYKLRHIQKMMVLTTELHTVNGQKYPEFGDPSGIKQHFFYN